jgi:hypothetical protein
MGPATVGLSGCSLFSWVQAAASTAAPRQTYIALNLLLSFRIGLHTLANNFVLIIGMPRRCL